MKKFVLFILLALTTAANAAHVQITFIEGFLIHPIYESDFSSIGLTTSDPGINAIFADHGVTYCYSASDGSTMIFAAYSGSAIADFISALEFNANVDNVKITPVDNHYADRFYIKLVSGTTGNPTGTDSDGNIVTSSVPLNQIFETFGVWYMEYLVNTSYEVRFSGDIINLEMALANLPAIVTYVEYHPVSFLLNQREDVPATYILYPNPFATTISIDTSEEILAYQLFDITGKQLVLTSSKSQFDRSCLTLYPGVYIVRLLGKSQQIDTYKIIKR